MNSDLERIAARVYREAFSDKKDITDPSLYQQGLLKAGTTITKERDPNGLDSKEPGSKLDAGKSPVMQGVLQYFPRALLEVGRVSQKGSEKYSWRGWASVPDGKIRYGNALVRHIISEGIEGDYDWDTGLLHAAQTAWNALARLELILEEKEKK